MISGLTGAILWKVMLGLLAPFILCGGLACSDQSPNIGKFYKGRILHISIAAMERTDELRWTTSPRSAAPGSTGDTLYKLTPQKPDNELVLLRVKVENHTATTAAVNVDEQSAQLRDFLQGRYFPVNVGERAEPAGVPEKPGDHCTVPVNPEKPTVCVEFLWNQTFEEAQPDGQTELVQYSQQLPQGTGLDGWMVFEVPQDTMIRSFRWGAGDTITVDF